MIRKAIRNPRAALQHLVFTAFRTYWWRRYVGQAKRLGLNDVFLLLSFDCDTDPDARAAASIHPQLTQRKLQPVYAVPGRILEAHASVFRTICHTGGRFINHGFARHTYFDERLKRFTSCFFYDRLTSKEITQDVVKGHETLQSVLQVTPDGFRTPHFGTFQRTYHLDFLYKRLRGLGYRYSSSTIPLAGFLHGPLYHPRGRADITEFPVSGHPHRPTAILDSWRYWNASSRSLDFVGFRHDVLTLTELLIRYGGAGIVNLYADPSHLEDEEFPQLMDECVRLGVRPSNYEALLSTLKS